MLHLARMPGGNEQGAVSKITCFKRSTSFNCATAHSPTAVPIRPWRCFPLTAAEPIPIAFLQTAFVSSPPMQMRHLLCPPRPRLGQQPRFCNRAFPPPGHGQGPSKGPALEPGATCSRFRYGHSSLAPGAHALRYRSRQCYYHFAIPSRRRYLEM